MSYVWNNMIVIQGKKKKHPLEDRANYPLTFGCNACLTLISMLAKMILAEESAVKCRN